MGETFHVFISYARADAGWVHVLAENLFQAGLEVFLDAWEIGPGDVLVHRIDEALLRSQNGVLVVTPTALERPWVMEEYAAMMTRAIEGQMRLIPVLLADAEMPPLLASRVWVDFRGVDGPEYERRILQLVAVLKGERPGPQPRTGVLKPFPGTGVRAAGPLRRRLQIGTEEIVLTGSEEAVRHEPPGLSNGTQTDLWELARERRRRPEEDEVLLRAAAVPAEATTQPPLHLRQLAVGADLCHDFLAGPAGEALNTAIGEAERTGSSLELALEVSAELADLPWETLRWPGTGDEPGAPLVLHPNVRLYRTLGDLGTAPAIQIPGPLRILVAIGSPEEQNDRGELLDMERELQQILDAVEPARARGGAVVRILHRGSVQAIKQALQAQRFHVLHISCHAAPGLLILEDDEGGTDKVTPKRLCDEALVPDRRPPLVVLAGCATAQSDRTEEKDEETEGEATLPNLARTLLERGVPAVLAMQASVSDPYATALAARLYHLLATMEEPQPLVALSEARRDLELARQQPDGGLDPRLAEWATPSLLLHGPSLRLFDRDAPFERVEELPEPQLAPGVVVRRVGDIVGRRRELRLTLQHLRRTDSAGTLLHGLGGVGKSSLAAEVVHRLATEGWLVVSVFGHLEPETIIDAVGTQLLGLAAAYPSEQSEQLRQLALFLRRPDQEWEARFQALAQHVLARMPVLMLLDNFESNLEENNTGWQVADTALGELLARWLARPGRSRVLITSRHPFPLPAPGQDPLEPLHVGPLSFAETRKLMWRLDGLDRLGRDDKLRAHTDVGGHPRALEYLDALLRGGEARFDDVAKRLEAALSDTGIKGPREWMAGVKGDLDRALAETVTLAADDVLLDRLLQRLDQQPLARQLLLGASVYRAPVDPTALAWQVGERVELEKDPALERRFEELNQAAKKAATGGGEQSLEAIGSSQEEWSRLHAYRMRLPIKVDPNFEPAARNLLQLGLLAPIPQPGSDGPLFSVHRWTAGALERRSPAAHVHRAHHRAASFWRWRVDVVPQSPAQAVEKLLEARYHHHRAGEIEEAVEVTEGVCLQLDAWGAFRREERLCMECLGWVPERSKEAAIFLHQLGIVSQKRGDHKTALLRYQRALEINDELGDRAGMANCYGQLGRVAQDLGELDQALSWYQRALGIFEEIGDRAGMATCHHQLGILEHLRGEHEKALRWYRRSLDINEELGDLAGMANSYHQLGVLAQERDDHDKAIRWHKKSLDIREGLGNRAGMANSYHQLGMLAQQRGDHENGLQWYQRSLDINEELGNRAGMAKVYALLGAMAQERDDQDQALHWYRRALEIFEELGNRIGIAASSSRIGILLTERGAAQDAVPLNLKSLSIMLSIGLPEAHIDLQWLRQQRSALGAGKFGEILSAHLDEASKAAVLQMLDQEREGK